MTKKILVLCIILVLLYLVLKKPFENFDVPDFNVTVIKDFLNKSEIDIVLSDCDNFHSSTIVSENGNISSNYRTSKTCVIKKDSKSHNLILEKIKKFNLENYNIEDLQLTKYKEGEFYKSHHDFFDHNKESEKNIIKSNGQRLKTIFVYLKKADMGGGTRFNRINKEFNLSNGDALYWNNCYKTDNTYVYEYNSEHEGTTVLKGEKIGINIWLTDKQ